MIDNAAHSANLDSVEHVLRDELAHGDAAAETVLPILTHLLASDDNSLFSDEIIARVRGMVNDLAVQLLDELSLAAGEEERVEHAADEIAGLTDSFIHNPSLLSHIHALALEWQLTERMQGRLSLDAVLSPLIQALIASRDDETATLAMQVLASQARFCQAQRRMKLPLTELPGDLLHSVLVSMRAVAGIELAVDQCAAKAESKIRAGYDETLTRIGMISRLVTSMGSAAIAALSIDHAGVAIFVTALAIGSGQERDAAVQSTNEAQAGRLALSLRSAGLTPSGVEEQFLALHPDVCLPEGFDRIDADRAAAILADARGYEGG